MGRLIIYDTSNYTDFPIGGQLTSIRGFLRFLVEFLPEKARDSFLVGVTTEPGKVGSVQTIDVFGKKVKFLPVTAAETNLSNTQHSLRLKFAKGLLKYGKLVKVNRRDCNYIQTPEAYGPARLLNPFTPCVIFSHGSYANMERGFRFFKKNPIIKNGFLAYIKWVLKDAKLIFILDEDSRRDYAPYTKRVQMARNSITVPEAMPKKSGDLHTLLFVGRLSKDKGVDGIIKAVKLMGDTKLVVVGDGEYREELMKEAAGDHSIIFEGAVTPDRVHEFMEKADILIMNSSFEGLPMTILEAQSHALPVVTTDVGGIGAAVNYGEDAERTDGTPESIVKAVGKVYDSYENYSKAAYNNAKGFDYRVVNEDIFKKLVEFWKD